MRRLLLSGWLVLPIAGWAYHEGPGQDRLRMDEADAALRRAHAAAVAEDWADSVAEYEAALKVMPKSMEAETRRARLELNKARMLAKQLPTAHDELTALVEELAADPRADAALLAEARSTQANAQYYMTWLMRLEGQPRDKWEPEIEAARQTYRLLAEQAERSKDEAAGKRHREDLESSIRLARMELKDLQGLPLPSQ
ncbi:MAG: hypothetical protein R3F56_11810 [Planctomycetota bacterium]